LKQDLNRLSVETLGKLSIVFINDREAYTNNKTDFIKEILLKCGKK